VNVMLNTLIRCIKSPLSARPIARIDMSLRKDDVSTPPPQEMLDMMPSHAGRIREEIISGDISTGAPAYSNRPQPRPRDGLPLGMS